MGSRIKYVSHYLNNRCLAYSEAVEINLPNFSTINDLNKDALLLYCLNHNTLKHYFPDHLSASSITRQYILQVIHAKDKAKYDDLEKIVRLFNNYKANFNKVTITVNNEFMSHLNSFEPLVQPNPNSRIFSLSNIPGLNNNDEQLNGLDKQERRIKRKEMVVNLMREQLYGQQNNNLQD